MKCVNKDGNYKVMFVKQGNGSYSSRVSIPTHYLKDLGITIDDRLVHIKRVERGILIEKAEKKEIAEHDCEAKVSEGTEELSS